MYTGPERRKDVELRATIDEYERQASLAREQAERATSAEVREKLTSLANSLRELADALKGRPKKR